MQQQLPEVAVKISTAVEAEMAETLTVVTAEAYLSATHYIQLE